MSSMRNSMDIHPILWSYEWGMIGREATCSPDMEWPPCNCCMLNYVVHHGHNSLFHSLLGCGNDYWTVLVKLSNSKQYTFNSAQLLQKDTFKNWCVFLADNKGHSTVESLRGHGISSEVKLGTSLWDSLPYINFIICLVIIHLSFRALYFRHNIELI
jgi:hypothetical protein